MVSLTEIICRSESQTSIEPFVARRSCSAIKIIIQIIATDHSIAVDVTDSYLMENG